MDFFQHFVIGFIMAFAGLLPPGMLNMTAMKTAVAVDKKAGFLFSLGAALIVIPQAFIALYFANYFAKHPEIIENISFLGVIVLFLLSGFFFWLARKKNSKESKIQSSNFFFMGMIMSALNMLAIPYYLVYSTLLESRDILILERNYILFFVFGAFFGAFALFTLFVLLSDVLIKRAKYIARNLNYLLSILFFFLAIFTLINIFNN
ncbi:LysE family transporter [Namhaeicola litoreus]|uniref:LysE family transporter n=1 Tax=Namhaeicola litoreus TaxID=1052145 RepID=A0ABW3Y4D5_9FLAO